MYQIDRVLKTRTHKVTRQLLVRLATRILILGLPLKMFAMPKDFCVTFMSNVSDPLYND